jgi:transposase-like protein
VVKEGPTETNFRALRQAESGTRVDNVYRELGISEAAFYVWKRKYHDRALSELRQLREENNTMKVVGRQPPAGPPYLAGHRVKKL